MSEPTDVLWIATKTYQLEDALKAIVSVPPAIVPLLNGVDHVAVLRSRYGDDRVIPATIAVEAERTSDGHYVQRSPVRLNIAASGEPLLGDTAQELRDLGFLCSFIANEASLLWGKLCFLGPFALVTAASGKNLGEILADPEWKKTLDYAFAEARAVAEAFGAQIDPARIQAILDSSPPTMRSSMAKDLDCRAAVGTGRHRRTDHSRRRPMGNRGAYDTAAGGHDRRAATGKSALLDNGHRLLAGDHDVVAVRLSLRY